MNTVLEFDGTPASANFGDYFPSGINLPNFFWEFWASLGDGASGKYLISDGHGGAHAILFGPGGLDSKGRYTFTGNIYNGTSSTSFGSDEGPAPDQWSHLGLSWDGSFLTVWYDGVPAGRKAFSGPRRSPGTGSGGGTLFIGGSDHQNLIGKIAQVRAFESNLQPRMDFAGNGASRAAFAPQTLFGRDAEATFLVSFLQPTPIVSDLIGKPWGG
jgi:hypothetical protein